MMIRFVCPLGHRLSVPSHRAGKKGRCPVCNEKVVVPVPNPRADGTDAPDEEGAADEEAAQPQVASTAPVASSVASTASPIAGPSAAGPVSSPQPSSAFAAPGALTIPGLGFRPGPARAAHAPPGKVSGGAPANVPAPMQPVPQAAALHSPAMAHAPVAQTPAGQAFAAQIPAPIPTPRPFENLPEIKHLEAPGPEYSAVPTQLPNVKLGTVASNALKANKGKMQTVYMLGVGLSLVVLASALPALGHLNIVEAPGWARAVFLLAALQLVYVAWMMALPDWSTVWVGMWLFAVVAALYAMVLMIVTFTAPGKPMMLSLYDVQQTAKGWSAIMVLLMGLMSYMCGRVSMSWRKAFELAKAKRPSGATR